MNIDKVFIISPHRCGSTNLMKTLSTLLNINYVEEPWNYYLYYKDIYRYPECIIQGRLIKSLLEQKAANWNGTEVEFYLNAIKYFDHIILLSRKSRIELAESYARQMYIGTTESWHLPYTLDSTDHLHLEMDKINKWCDDVETISKETGIPITWYEDLYSGDIKKIEECTNKWGIGIQASDIVEYVNPKNKYRKRTPIVTVTKLI